MKTTKISLERSRIYEIPALSHALAGNIRGPRAHPWHVTRDAGPHDQLAGQGNIGGRLYTTVFTTWKNTFL